MNPRRFFVSVSAKSRHWSQTCESAQAVIEIALALARENNLVDLDTGDPKLLIEERWSSRTHFVFEIHHDTYDSERAHLP